MQNEFGRLWKKIGKGQDKKLERKEKYNEGQPMEHSEFVTKEHLWDLSRTVAKGQQIFSPVLQNVH